MEATGDDEKVAALLGLLEPFGIIELALPPGHGATATRGARLVIDGQPTVGFVDERGALRFRFSPKDAKTYTFTVQSDVPELQGRTGAFTAVRPSASAAEHPSARLPNWWTDNPAPEFAEGPHLGAKTVSRWRASFLRDFANRLERARAPAAKP